MEIKRDIYRNKLIQRMHSGQVKVITGIRGCGKTCLLKRFQGYLLAMGVDREHIIALSLDDAENQTYRDADALNRYLAALMQDQDMYYVLLDEVQHVEGFESVLNGLLYQGNVDVYVTGSYARFLSREVRTEFRGRGDVLQMDPLSFAEFLDGYHGNRRDGWKMYLTYGGLPAVVQKPAPEDKAALLQNLVEEVYLPDIARRYHIRSLTKLRELLRVLASSEETFITPVELATALQTRGQGTISTATVQKYLDALSDSFLISKVARRDIRSKRPIHNQAKYYWTDLGLRNALLGFQDLDESRAAENILYNELCIRDFQVDVGVVVGNGSGAENDGDGEPQTIDFVCNRVSLRLYIQCLSDSQDQEEMERKQLALMQTGDCFPKIVIAGGAFIHYNDRGILITGITDFLLKEHILGI